MFIIKNGSLKQLRIDIKERLLAEVPMARHVNTWNSHEQQIIDRDNYPFDFPAVFFEIDRSQVQVLGDGYRIYDPLDIKIHVLHRLEDSGNGNFDENLDIEDVQEQVRLALEGYEFDGSSVLFLTSDVMDHEHDSVSHSTMIFRCCYVDSKVSEPRNPITIEPPIDIQITTGFNETEESEWHVG